MRHALDDAALRLELARAQRAEAGAAAALDRRGANTALALKALGERRRVEILRLLRAGPRAVGEIGSEWT